MSQHEKSYWQARGLCTDTGKYKPCERCGTLDGLAYSKIANMRLCKQCWVEAAEIYDKYKAMLVAWKENR